MTMTKFLIRSVLFLALACTGLFGVYYLFNYKYIQPDEIGVWMVNGGNNGIQDYKPYQGHFPIDFSPATKGFVLPAQPWTIDCDQKIIYSRQKGEWTVDPQFTFRIDRVQAPLVCFRNIGMLGSDSKESKEKFLESVGGHLLTPVMNDIFNEILATNSDSSLMENTFRFQRIIEDSIRVRFLRAGYILETFVSNLNPPQSIIAKNRAKNEAEAAALTAKADVIKAEAEAKVLMATTTSEANAMLVTERANAEVVRLKREALSPLVIQQEWIAKWNGELPTYVTGSNTGMMLNIK